MVLGFVDLALHGFCTTCRICAHFEDVRYSAVAGGAAASAQVERASVPLQEAGSDGLASHLLPSGEAASRLESTDASPLLGALPDVRTFCEAVLYECLEPSMNLP